MSFGGNEMDIEEEGEEDLFLIDTALENSLSFAECWRNNISVEGLLKRDDHISVRATSIRSGVDLEELHHKSDIDGLTIEWLNLASGLKSDFRHIEIVPLGARSVRRFYPVIKKHINLSPFNKNSFSVLKDTVGTQIIYDGLFETWLGFIPDPREWRTIYDFGTQCHLAHQFLERLRVRFQDGLKELFKKGIALETLAKNNINDARRMFVLPGHQSHILANFQLALEETDLIELPYFKKVLFTFRFGDKCVTPMQLPVKDVNAVGDICVHVGHRISSDYVDLMWSQQGVKEVSGSNCIISSAYSLIECANLQSALSTSRLDISGELKAVCKFPQSIRFVQLYNDLPHRYPKTRVHPVSASVIMLEGVLTDVAQKNLYSDASAYLSEIGNNFFQIDRGICRLEFVVSIGKREKAISGAEFVRLDRLTELLEKHPMIVPFLRHACTLKLFRVVGLYLHHRLATAFRTGRGTGNTRLTWEVYQNELAVEKLLWGRPLCSLSNQYSKNLGPGVQYPTRSLTDQRGFLCLEDSGSCCVDDVTLPPLNLFSKNETIKRQIQNISGFYNLIGGSKLALGRRLMEILLRDCHANGKIFFSFEHFALLLKVRTGNADKHIVGGISCSEVAKMLSQGKKFKWTFVFGAVIKLLLKLNINVEEVIQYGINGLTLGYFPALRGQDESRNMGINWEYKYGFWVLTDIPDKESEVEREAAAMKNLVITELEKRKLCHSSKCIGTALPWIPSVLEKLRERKLPVESKVTILAFISCVAFLGGGRYVNYYSLKKLERDLPLTQSTLRMLEIQSPFLLPGLNNVKIFRLHPSVPLKLDLKQKEAVVSRKPQECSNLPVSSMQNDKIDVIEPDENAVLATDTHDMHVHPVPSNKCYTRWSPAEVAIIGHLKENCTLTVSQKYKEYQKACRELNLPDRSFQSFRVKLIRLNNRT